MMWLNYIASTYFRDLFLAKATSGNEEHESGGYESL